MKAVDAVLKASVDAVKKSGALESGALMATVSVINDNGTVDVVRGDDTYPKVRILSGYIKPLVGDRVEILRSAGGWVCVGSLRSSSAPRIQSGRATTPAGTGSPPAWGTVSVTFPTPFSSAPVVVATPAEAISSGSTEVEVAVSDITTTGFTLRCRRVNNGVSGPCLHNWIATNF